LYPTATPPLLWPQEIQTYPNLGPQRLI
jgi:hypothetical protein